MMEEMLSHSCFVIRVALFGTFLFFALWGFDCERKGEFSTVLVSPGKRFGLVSGASLSKECCNYPLGFAGAFFCIPG